MFNPPSTANRIIGRVLWLLLGLLIVFYVLPVLLTGWPPNWVERRTQRQKVVERIQSAGGWTALQQDCDTLVQQHREDGFAWFRQFTTALPPALAALKPMEIRFDPPAAARGSEGQPQVAVVRVRIFGMPATGGHATPYFGLEVVSGPGAESYRPKSGTVGVPGNHHSTYRKVTDRIYEIY